MLFRLPELSPLDETVISRVEELRASLRHHFSNQRRWVGSLRRVSLARAIQGSNSIEGYNVSLDDAAAVAQGEEPLDADAETRAAVAGYRDAMTYVLQLSDDRYFSYSEDLVRSLHFMMMRYDLDKSPGRWRPGVIYVRNEQTGKIVYEGPDAQLVPDLVHELIGDLNESTKEPVLARAAMAHLNLVMIHPFRDGNGRMARCLQTLVLAREGILAPEFCSIEEYLGRNTQAYYDVLGEVGSGSWQPEGDARPWLRFTLTAHYRQARTLLRRVREADRMWELLDTEVRRRGLPTRLIAALWDASLGFRMRNATYRAIAGEDGAEISAVVAMRDLKALVQAGLLAPHGERRGRFYAATPKLLELRQRSREPRPLWDEDPFEESAA